MMQNCDSQGFIVFYKQIRSYYLFCQIKMVRLQFGLFSKDVDLEQE